MKAIVIRFTDDEVSALDAAAYRDGLKRSTWAKGQILKSVRAQLPLPMANHTPSPETKPPIVAAPVSVPQPQIDWSTQDRRTCHLPLGITRRFTKTDNKPHFFKGGDQVAFGSWALLVDATNVQPGDYKP